MFGPQKITLLIELNATFSTIMEEILTLTRLIFIIETKEDYKFVIYFSAQNNRRGGCVNREKGKEKIKLFAS